MRLKPWLKYTKAFLFYILTHKTIVKDSTLMGKNFILTRLALLLTLVQPCTRFRRVMFMIVVKLLLVLLLISAFVGLYYAMFDGGDDGGDVF